jgi:hypothetical protein
VVLELGTISPTRYERLMRCFLLVSG